MAKYLSQQIIEAEEGELLFLRDHLRNFAHENCDGQLRHIAFSAFPQDAEGRVPNIRMINAISPDSFPERGRAIGIGWRKGGMTTEMMMERLSEMEDVIQHNLSKSDYYSVKTKKIYDWKERSFYVTVEIAC